MQKKILFTYTLHFCRPVLPVPTIRKLLRTHFRIKNPEQPIKKTGLQVSPPDQSYFISGIYSIGT